MELIMKSDVFIFLSVDPLNHETSTYDVVYCLKRDDERVLPSSF